MATPNAKKPAAAKEPRRANIKERMAAARAARAEAAGERPVLEGVGDGDITLPLEMPYEFLRLWESADFHGALVALFDGDMAPVESITDGLSVDDLGTIVEVIGELYGVDEGK